MCLNVLITGAAGFIGSALVKKILRDNRIGKVIGVDNLHGDIALKSARLQSIEKLKSAKWQFVFGDISDAVFMQSVLAEYKPRVVVNLAAQAGVPYGELYPEKTFQPNVAGFFTILNACANSRVKHFIFASSSSVYGNKSNCDAPQSFYAATKRADEILAYSFTDKISVTGLRLFSVYGQWGRPDMLYFKAAENFLRDEPIYLYDYGKIRRDFTFVGDVAESFSRVIFKKPKQNFNLYDVGRGQPLNILGFVSVLIPELIAENVLKKDVEHYNKLIRFEPATAADILSTRADVAPFKRDFNFVPQTDICTGLEEFARWFKSYQRR